jgi:hypothetical protein
MQVQTLSRPRLRGCLSNGKTRVWLTRDRGSIPRSSTIAGEAIGMEHRLASGAVRVRFASSPRQRHRSDRGTARCAGIAEGSVRPRAVALFGRSSVVATPRFERGCRRFESCRPISCTGSQVVRQAPAKRPSTGPNPSRCSHGSPDDSGCRLLSDVARFNSAASYAFEVALEATPLS